MEIRIVIDDDVDVPPISATFEDVPLGSAFETVLVSTGLGYDSRPAIEVMPEELDD
jgi:hypothetical protein